ADRDVHVNIEAMGHMDTERQKDGHRAPGRAGGKGDDRTDEEQHRRYHGGWNYVYCGVNDKLGSAHIAAYAAHSPGTDDDDENTGHVLDAVNKGVKCFSEGHQLLFDDHDAQNNGSEEIA